MGAVDNTKCVNLLQRAISNLPNLNSQKIVKMMNVTAKEFAEFLSGKYSCIETSKIIHTMSLIKDSLYKNDSSNKQLDELYNEYVQYLKDKQIPKDTNSESKEKENDDIDLRKQMDEIINNKPLKRGRKDCTKMSERSVLCQMMHPTLSR